MKTGGWKCNCDYVTILEADIAEFVVFSSLFEFFSFDISVLSMLLPSVCFSGAGADCGISFNDTEFSDGVAGNQSLQGGTGVSTDPFFCIFPYLVGCDCRR